MGLFSPTHAFSGGFWQISLKRSLYVNNLFLRFMSSFMDNYRADGDFGTQVWRERAPVGFYNFQRIFTIIDIV